MQGKVSFSTQADTAELPLLRACAMLHVPYPEQAVSTVLGCKPCESVYSNVVQQDPKSTQLTKQDVSKD